MSDEELSPHPSSLSCSTVTVTKCQAALRTLQAFPFFAPTCLCREPQVDHECNSFRNFLFDHPCIFVINKEKDPYPIDALPTCNHALSVCQKDDSCIQIFEHFKSHCKVRDGKCHMEDREMCLESWSRIRLTPMFGCICPNNHMKKRCERIFTLVNHNPCLVRGVARWGLLQHLVSPWIRTEYRPSNYSAVEALFSKESSSSRSGSKQEEEASLSFQNTCDAALDSCRREPACKAALSSVTQYCSQSGCRKENCMQSLQAFYRTVDSHSSLEIAFCLCKKTKNLKDECLMAQELLHPVCAQQPQNNLIPTCHSLAHSCMDDPTCRIGLENYVQACAVDAVTKQCAGPPQVCRTAMLGILGTALRSNCACKGTDFSQLYDCMGWQRVLWFNPCVVESQRDFHARKNIASISVVVTEGSKSVGSTSISRLMSEANSKNNGITEHTTSLPPASLQATSPPTTAALPSVTTITRKLAALTVAPTTSTIRSTAFTVMVATSLSTSTTVATTTTTPRPSPTPPRYCVVPKPEQETQYIAEGDGRRIYREGEPDCSDVCQCGDGSLICNTICLERHPCQSDFATYNHDSPSYQAYRGRCLCYSGRFICMRPLPETYELPQGVFLFLGYSEADESLLKPLIKMEVQDAVSSLHNLLRRHVKPKTPCMLQLFSMSTENVILIAKLSDSNSTLTRNVNEEPNPSLLIKQKEECEGPLREISDMINNQHSIIHSHLLLSIFKMAEVDVVYPTANCASRPLILFTTIFKLSNSFLEPLFLSVTLFLIPILISS
ncbi:uncharacterized protein [Rhodnius prolixus]|uniref:uncharacterized protein n=1 Tax=Rhodnius prolixus TaxID=13249 RepID=UPI003D18BEBF